MVAVEIIFPDINPKSGNSSILIHSATVNSFVQSYVWVFKQYLVSGVKTFHTIERKANYKHKLN